VSEPEEEYAQGTWEHIKPPKRIGRRKDGRAPRNFIDVEAFARLAKRGFDGSPQDAREEEEDER
jgi:hypothetical protein